MRRAAQDVKVILDGQGGDELFAGYLPYLVLRIRDLLAKPDRASRAAGLPPGGRGSLALGRQRAWRARCRCHCIKSLQKGLAVLRRRTPAISGPEEPPFFHPSLAERVAGTQIERARPRRFDDLLSDTLYWHLVQQSIPALLHYEDRNSMAFSIEARVPYLDYRIVEFALALDPGIQDPQLVDEVGAAQGGRAGNAEECHLAAQQARLSDAFRALAARRALSQSIPRSGAVALAARARVHDRALDPILLGPAPVGRCRSRLAALPVGDARIVVPAFHRSLAAYAGRCSATATGDGHGLGARRRSLCHPKPGILT